MSKRHHPYAAGGQGGWSIRSSSLSPSGQAELMKELGLQLQQDYQDVLKEPAPDRIRELLERLEHVRRREDEEEP